MDEFEERGSGWRYLASNHLRVGINEVHIAAQGSSYIRLPLWVSRKKAVLNIANFNDNLCFLYCLLAHLFPNKLHAQRPTVYPNNFHDYFNLTGIKFPMKLNNIAKFEHLNPTFSVNVFGIEKEAIVGPLYHTKSKKENHVDLLLVTQGENSHYCLIKNMSKLLGSSVSKNEHKKFFCTLCLSHFRTKEKKEEHERDCSLFKPVKLTFPDKENAFIQFSSHRALLKKPYVVIADFESLTVPIKENTPTSNSTYFYEKHEPIAVGFATICSFNSANNTYRSHCSKDVVPWFIDQLKLEAQRIYHSLLTEEKPKPVLTLEEQNVYDSVTKCPICDCVFSEENPKCFHHDHYNQLANQNIEGTARLQNGAICSNCNLKIQKDFSVPVFFHNLSRYDAHLFIKELVRHSQVSVIPTNTETYIAFSSWFGPIKFLFLDSFRFLPESLEKLVSNLSPDQLNVTKSHFPDPNQFNLLIRKQVFCYDYMDSEEKLSQPFLPEKKHFFNQLTFEHISDADYEHAQTVWNVFGCKNLRDYTMLYLKSDVLLLSDVIENFRELTLKYYGVDGAGFYTTPGLSWSSALKMTKKKLELFTCPDMYNFITKAIRGGLTNSITRHASANNPFTEGFDPNKEITYIHYLDFVNLYGSCLMQPLPVGDFRWLSAPEIDRVRTMLESGQSNYKEYFDFQKDKNIILEVDLEYDKSLHDLHNQMPFCPEHVIPKNCTQSKLMCTLTNKHRYVTHLKNLTQCLRHGLKLTKIHRVLEFTEEAWLRPYIELNTRLRAAALTEFERNFFKLLINAIFGKTIENDRKKRDVKLVSRWAQARKLILKPNFLRSTIISEDFVIMEFRKTEILVNKPVFCGFSVLEFAKYSLYGFHFEYIMKELSPFFKINLCYQDTDSQVYAFTLKENTDKNLSFYDFMRRDCLTHFDTSNFPVNNVCNIPIVNEKVPGKMKSETGFKSIREWLSIRPKIYAMLVGENILQNPRGEKGKVETIRKIKGVAKSASKHITFKDFRDCLFNNVTLKTSFNTIQSKNHDLFTLNVRKLALFNEDNKRYSCGDYSIETLAIGHYKLDNL